MIRYISSLHKGHSCDAKKYGLLPLHAVVGTCRLFPTDIHVSNSFPATCARLSLSLLLSHQFFFWFCTGVLQGPPTHTPPPTLTHAGTFCAFSPISSLLHCLPCRSQCSPRAGAQTPTTGVQLDPTHTDKENTGSGCPPPTMAESREEGSSPHSVTGQGFVHAAALGAFRGVMGLPLEVGTGLGCCCCECPSLSPPPGVITHVDDVCVKEL